MIHPIDGIVLVAYLIVVGAIGLWAARKQKTTDQYFVARRSMPAWAVAFTLMATLISSGTLVGHPATVYQKGMILLLGNLMLPVVLVFVAIVIIPFYRNVVKMSAYEYIGLRFGLGGRLYSSFGFMADRIFDVGVTLLTTAIPLRVITGWNLGWIIVVVGVFTILYTSIGGIEAEGDGRTLTVPKDAEELGGLSFRVTSEPGTAQISFTEGLARASSRALVRLTDSADGTLARLGKSIQSMIDRYASDIKAKQDQLEVRRLRLQQQYAALETTLNDLTAQGNYVTAQMQALRGVTNQNK